MPVMALGQFGRCIRGDNELAGCHVPAWTVNNSAVVTDIKPFRH